MKRKENIWNIANLITVLRLLLGIPLIYLAYTGERYISITLYAIFLFMDFIDGKIARWLKCETLFGKNLDIITDGAVGIGLIAVLIIQGAITPEFIIFSIIPIVLAIVGFTWGILIAKNTFIPSGWRKFNGSAYYLIILIFLINEERLIVIAYLLMAFYYLSWTKYLLEMRKAAK